MINTSTAACALYNDFKIGTIIDATIIAATIIAATTKDATTKDATAKDATIIMQQPYAQLSFSNDTNV